MDVETPSGTVTFLFTDIAGSTGLWESAPDAMQMALQRHDALLRSTIESAGGSLAGGGSPARATAAASSRRIAALARMAVRRGAASS